MRGVKGQGLFGCQGALLLGARMLLDKVSESFGGIILPALCVTQDFEEATRYFAQRDAFLDAAIATSMSGKVCRIIGVERAFCIPAAAEMPSVIAHAGLPLLGGPFFFVRSPDLDWRLRPRRLQLASFVRPWA